MSTSTARDRYMEQLVRYLVVAMTDDHDVAIGIVQSTANTRAKTIRIACSHVGYQSRLLGKKGRTLEALKRVIASIAWRVEETYLVSLFQPPDEAARDRIVESLYSPLDKGV